MTRLFEPADVPQALEAWKRAYAPKFEIDSRLLTQHIVDDQYRVPEGCLINPETGAWVSAKAPSSSLTWFGMDSHMGWIGAVAGGDAEEVNELLAAAERALAGKGLGTASFGSDPRHIYPGPPSDEEWLVDLLRRRGYTGDRSTYDLFARMDDLPVSEIPSNAGPASEADIESLKRFVSKEFAGRWQAETLYRLVIEADPSFCVVVRDGGEVVAFCHASHLGQKFLQPNLNFHLGLPCCNPGGIGTVGVATARRGEGLGKSVMLAAIETLREAAVDGICVDWTGLLAFYGQFGFKPHTRFEMLQKKLKF